MKYKYQGTIHYYYKGMVHSFSDIYSIPTYYERDYIHEYIKHDLMLVASGGYSTDNVKVIDFEIKQV